MIRPRPSPSAHLHRPPRNGGKPVPKIRARSTSGLLEIIVAISGEGDIESSICPDCTARAAAASGALPIAPAGAATQVGAGAAILIATGVAFASPLPVEHVIIHHADTANFNDPVLEMRSIYYFHAITRGWGDIAYNYLIDFMGNVYEGRVGGEGAAPHPGAPGSHPRHGLHARR